MAKREERKSEGGGNPQQGMQLQDKRTSKQMSAEPFARKIWAMQPFLRKMEEKKAKAYK